MSDTSKIMDLEDRVADLEHRVAELERVVGLQSTVLRLFQESSINRTELHRFHNDRLSVIETQLGTNK